MSNSNEDKNKDNNNNLNDSLLLLDNSDNNSNINNSNNKLIQINHYQHQDHSQEHNNSPTIIPPSYSENDNDDLVSIHKMIIDDQDSSNIIVDYNDSKLSIKCSKSSCSTCTSSNNPSSNIKSSEVLKSFPIGSQEDVYLNRTVIIQDDNLKLRS